MSIKKTRIWKFLSSIKLAVWLIAIIAAVSLLGTLIPQDRFDAYSSFWFLLLLILFSLNLTVCLVNRISFKIQMLGSALTHAGVLIVLIGALIGMLFGQKGFIKIGEGEEACCFISKGKHKIDLGFSIRLGKFIYNEHIDPKEKLLVYAPGPDEGHSGSPIAEVPTEIGVERDIAATGCKIEILRYLPDFAIDTVTKVASSRSALPNNPAIEVRLKNRNGHTNTFWVFARFPDIHEKSGADFKFVYHWVGRRPKDFISKVTVLSGGGKVMTKDIRVNEPLNFGGYTFFQYSYDTEALSWSALQVVKDPGVGLVYAGFALLILGLVIIFYINPFIRRR